MVTELLVGLLHAQLVVVADMAVILHIPHRHTLHMVLVREALVVVVVHQAPVEPSGRNQALLFYTRQHKYSR